MKARDRYTSHPKMPKGAKWITEAIYIYEDAGGRIKLRVDRQKAWLISKTAASVPVIEDKTNKQAKRCPQFWIAWEKKPPHAHDLPYRLPELRKRIEAGLTIFIVEGENKIDKLRQWGLVATCNAGGAGNWTIEHADEMREARDVVILPDNDDDGRKHADRVGRTLEKVAARRLLLELPDLPEHGDVVNWIAAGLLEAKVLSAHEMFVDDRLRMALLRWIWALPTLRPICVTCAHTWSYKETPPAAFVVVRTWGKADARSLMISGICTACAWRRDLAPRPTASLREVWPDAREIDLPHEAPGMRQ